MKQIRKQKGFVLLLVVALIPLVGMVSILLAANSKTLFTCTRRQAIKADAQFACESGLRWIEANVDKAASISKDKPVVLEIGPEGKVMTCTIELTAAMPEPAFLVTGHANDKRFSYEYKTDYILSN